MTISDMPSPWRFLLPLDGDDETDRKLIQLTRPDELKILVNMVIASKVTILYAFSGNGKTSLIDAGLIPAFIEKGYAVFKTRPRPPWSIHDPTRAFKDCIIRDVKLPLFSRQDLELIKGFSKYITDKERLDKIKNLLTRLEKKVKDSQMDSYENDEFKAHLQAHIEEPLPKFISHIRQLLPSQTRLIFICDQFEELFVHYGNTPEMRTFVSELGDVWSDNSLGVRLLFSMREDWVGSMIEFREAIPDIFSSYFKLKPLNRSRAEDVLKSPLGHIGMTFHGDAAGQILDDLCQFYTLIQKERFSEVKLNPSPPEDPFIELPALQVIAEKLWETRSQHQEPFSLAHYQSLADLMEKQEKEPTPVKKRPVDDRPSQVQIVLDRYLSDILVEIEDPSTYSPEVWKELRIDVLYLLTDRTRHRRALTEDALLEELNQIRPLDLDIPRTDNELLKEVIDPLIESRLVREELTADEKKQYELAHDFAVRSVVEAWRKLDRERAVRLAALHEEFLDFRKATAEKVPAKAWRVVFAGATINLCLGCLYAWSVWLKYLTNDAYMKAHGWAGALTAEQASNPKSLCILIFALLMVPGGKIQDKFGPKIAGIIGAVFMGLGMIIAGTAHSYGGILWGFGVGGGIAMGVAYAATVPAAVKWFGPHQRGLASGLVVSGYGGAAFYVAPLIKWIIISYSLSASFLALGVAYFFVIGVASLLLAWPEKDYVPPLPPEGWGTAKKAGAHVENWTAGEMTGTWQFYALMALFCLNTQAGLLIIGHAARIVKPFLESGFILVAAGGFVNAAGRIGTGKYSDIIGRNRAYMLNAGAAALCMFALPSIIAARSLLLAFSACMVAYWVYGGGLALLPAFTADFYGTKNLGMNYGLVFLGWGMGAFMPKLGGRIRDVTGSYDGAFYIAGILLIIAIFIALFTKKPEHKNLKFQEYDESQKEKKSVYVEAATPVERVPAKAWRVVFAGATINLCLGCLYAWAVWLKYLTDSAYMKSHGWAGAFTYEQASNPKSLTILLFFLSMIPGGKIQDRFGPAIAGTIGGVLIGIGLIIAGSAHSYGGILWGFGFICGIGMGIAYAAPIPAIAKWVGPHQRGFMFGIAIAGYGIIAFYAAPLVKWLIVSYSLSTSFWFLGVAYMIVIVIASRFLAWPEEGYVPPQPSADWSIEKKAAAHYDTWTAGEMARTWQFYALMALFCLNTQSGLLIIGHAAKIVKPFLESGFILVAAGGFMNAAGRIGTGKYSDIIGRNKAYMLNAGAAALCLFGLSSIIAAKSFIMAFCACMIAYWVYGGGLALLPAFTADYYGTKNLGMNYGLVFLGWGMGAFMPKLSGIIRDVTGSYDGAFYVSGVLLIFAIVIALVTRKPQKATA